MTLGYFKGLTEFNLWANDIVCSWLEIITDQQWHQRVNSSFDSIQATVQHICGTQKVWLDRINKNQDDQRLAGNFRGTKGDNIALLKKTSADLYLFVVNLQETSLEDLVFFKRQNGEENLMPYYQILAHVVNHSSYHRGQLVTMLRQVGFEKVGATDLAVFYRQKHAAQQIPVPTAKKILN